MASISTFDPALVVLTYAGHKLEKFGATSKVTVAPVSDEYVTVVGTDGKATRIRVNDPTFDVSFVLMNSSLSNDFISATLSRAKQARNGSDVGTMSIRDLNGTTVYEGSGYVKRIPDFLVQRAATEYTWQFTLVADIVFLGGLP